MRRQNPSATLRALRGEITARRGPPRALLRDLCDLCGNKSFGPAGRTRYFSRFVNVNDSASSSIAMFTFLSVTSGGTWS